MSRIDFRPDPADPDKDAIGLGLLLEFTTENYWAIGMVMLAAIDDAALARLDELSKKLIENREHIIGQEIRRTLPQAKKPGQALPLLAAANPWSMHISTPVEFDVSKMRPETGASVEKIAEQYALSLFPRDHASAKRKTAASVTSSSRDIVCNPALVLGPEDCPPPWILPPSCVFRPLHW